MALVLFTIPLTGKPAAGGDTAKSGWPTHGWRQDTPASVGLDGRVLAQLDSDLAQGKYSLVDSFQVFRCGTEVFSRTYSHDYGRI
ncbi:MAG TPA: hypothetical protein VLX90_22935, partial [Steroidobacteraceae bacterium]|nr:hypothetical protein [Steroidobacteraceae bacterium]